MSERDTNVEYEKGREEALAPIKQQLSDWRDMYEQDGEAKLLMSYVLNQLEHAIKKKP